jgi:hypothetical protein
MTTGTLYRQQCGCRSRARGHGPLPHPREHAPRGYVSAHVNGEAADYGPCVAHVHDDEPDALVPDCGRRVRAGRSQVRGRGGEDAGSTPAGLVCCS